jgi:ribosome-associated protein
MLNENHPDDQDNELLSKSQLKRDSHDLQKFGKTLVAMKPHQLEELDLPESLLYSLFEAQKILNKRSALKRQYQYIGKILRNIDLEPIFARYDRFANKTEINNKIQQQAEFWRDQIILNANDNINKFIEPLTVHFDRQQLRQLVRNIQSAKKDTQKSTYSKQIFRVLYTVLKQQDEKNNS